MHLVPLMKHTREQAREAARRIKASGDENLMALFLALGGKVYDRDELERWLAVMNQAILEIASTTSFGQDLMEMGRAKGVEAGRKEGRKEADHENRARIVDRVRDLLQRRFPDLVDHPSLKKVRTSERALRLLEGVLEAKSRKAVLEALSAV
jgi:predicted transposase YdaD